MRVLYFLGQIKKWVIKFLSNSFYTISFILNIPKKNTILLIEANNSHTELLPSFVKYLSELHYNIEIIANFQQKNMLPFLEADKVYYFNIPAISNILKLKKIKKYSFIIFTSYRLYYPTPDKKALQSTIFDYFDIKYAPEYNEKKGILYTLHHIEDYDKNNKNGAIILSKILKFHSDLYVVNPCYFKKNDLKNKNKKTVFAVTGKLECVRKNSALLFDAIYSLLEIGVKNFEINVIGDNLPDIIPCKLKEYIKIKGRMNFEDMYRELEKADFYLPLLDPDLEEHERYITTGTSGSFQLIRGFLLPPVINKTFAYPHGFNSNNSIIYDKNNQFYTSIKRAIDMSNEEYLLLQKELLIQRNKIYADSLNNLKTLLDSFIGR